jgi:GTPase SAR1 family protein
LVIVGVGKSSLLEKFINDSFDPIYRATIGAEFSSKIVKVNN